MSALSHEQLADSTTAAELTLAEWAELPEEETGELVDGRLVEEEVPDYLHELLVATLIRILGNWIVPRGGFVAGSEAKFVVGPKVGRKPDLTVYLPGSQAPPAQGPIETPPDIAVEVVSPRPRDGRRDRVDKMTEYAGFGITHYWILDPALRSLEIFELGSDGRYAYALGAGEGMLDSIPGCEGLTLDLDALWSEADRLAPREPRNLSE